MPIVAFDPRQKIIQVTVGVSDTFRTTLTVLVDTGAGQTGFRRSTLVGLGIDVERAEQVMRINTASGSLDVPVVNLPNFRVFGESFSNLPVLCLPLPPTVPADGVLGYDVLSRFRLFVNYRRSILVAEPFNGLMHGVRFLWQVVRTL
ncbi:MAG: aspartyl protease family protein [Armatimonadota bacterium]